MAAIVLPLDSVITLTPDSLSVVLLEFTRSMVTLGFSVLLITAAPKLMTLRTGEVTAQPRPPVPFSSIVSAQIVVFD